MSAAGCLYSADEVGKFIVNLPFSLGDILERIAPGAIFLFSLAFVIDFEPLVSSGSKIGLLENSVISLSLLLLVSYTLGVMFNIIAGAFKSIDGKYIDLRYAMIDDPDNEHTPATEREIQKSIRETFKVPPNKDSWRLCYGIAQKSQMGVNIELFGRINVFCRSMLVSFAIIALIIVMKNIFVIVCLILTSSKIALDIYPLIHLGISVVLAVTFFRGSRIYSKAFSSAIYESFYTWYCVEKVLSERG